MRSIAAYTRVSSADQVERLSLATQERLVKEYCSRQGWPEPTLYVDAGKSAYNDDLEKRPRLAALVTAIQAGEYDALIIYDLDRLARNAVMQLTLAQQLAKAGCRLISLNQSTDLATPEGKMMYTFNAGINEFYSAQISRKTKAGLAEIAARGGYVGGIPYGARRNAEYRLELDPAKEETLALLLRLVAAGGYNHAVTELNRRGLPTPKTAPFWEPSSVASIVTRGRWLLEQPTPWPSLWANAATRPRASRANKNRPPRELTGMTRCACGGVIVYGGVNILRDGTRVLRFQCRHFTKERPSASGCPYPKRNAAYYEAECTRQFVVLPDVRRTVLISPDIQAARDAIRERRRHLNRAIAHGMEDVDADPIRAAIEADEALLPLDTGTELLVAEDVYTTQWVWPSLDAPRRNAAWRRFASTIIIEGATVRIVWVPPLQRLLDQWCRDRGVTAW